MSGPEENVVSSDSPARRLVGQQLLVLGSVHNFAGEAIEPRESGEILQGRYESLRQEVNVAVHDARRKVGHLDGKVPQHFACLHRAPENVRASDNSKNVYFFSNSQRDASLKRVIILKIDKEWAFPEHPLVRDVKGNRDLVVLIVLTSSIEQHIPLQAMYLGSLR